MNFGGYVSYTVDGFKCRAFGTEEIKNAIDSSSFELDMPTSLALKLGRKGFRRTAIKSPAGAIVIYSAFVGLSEPNTTRQGSFLAIGITGGPELNCAAMGLGHRLCDLLDDLARRVSDGSRFTSDLSDDMLNGFLREKSSVLKEMHAKLVPGSHSFGDKASQGVIFLSEEKIWRTPAFNQVCEYVRGEVDFFLFEEAERSEVQSARHYFRIEAWPVRKDRSDPALAAASGNHQARQLQPQNPSSQEGAGELSAPELRQALKRLGDDDKRIFDRVVAIEKKTEPWKFILIGIICTAFALFLIAIVLPYQWASAGEAQISDLGKRVQHLEALSRQRPVSGLGGNSTDTDPKIITATMEPRTIETPRPMNYNEVNKEFCPEYKGDNFGADLRGLNPGVENDKGVIARRTRITLPKGCGP